jgi:hypothetical protein
VDAAVQRRIGNHAPVPNGFKKFVLRNHPVTPLDKRGQHAEYLRFEIEWVPAPFEFEAFAVKREFTELVDHDPDPAFPKSSVPKDKIMQAYKLA